MMLQSMITVYICFMVTIFITSFFLGSLDLTDVIMVGIFVGSYAGAVVLVESFSKNLGGE